MFERSSLLCSASQLAGKYDPHKEEELRLWIEDVTGKRTGDSFMDSLKDGVLLCEWVDGRHLVFVFLKQELSSNLSLALSFCRLINALQPGSVKKINHSSQNWHQVMLQLSKLLFSTPSGTRLPHWHWQQRLLFNFHKVASISNEAHLSTAFISLVLDQEKANRALKRWLKRLSESSRCDIDTAAHAHRPSHSRTLQGHGRKSRVNI